MLARGGAPDDRRSVARAARRHDLARGGCALAASAVAASLPPGARMIDAGYVASEVRGTVVVDAERGLALPLLDDVFFEFVPVEDWDRGHPRHAPAHEIERRAATTTSSSRPPPACCAIT